MENMIITNKKKIEKGRIKTNVILTEIETGKNAKIRKAVLDEFSITDQLRVMRKAIISGDTSQLIIMDEKIDEIISTYKDIK